MSWNKVKLSKVLKQYRVTHIVQNDRDYKQVTISKHDGVKFRGLKNGKEIGRKRQFIIDLKKYPNTLMLVRQGVYDGAIGIAPIEVDGCIATENMPMFSIEGINIDFLNLIIQSPYFKEELEKIPTTGSAQKSIHERQILEIEIPLPKPEIQGLIVQAFKQNQLGLNEISTELTHQLELVKQLRQAFLREAMQGKLEPQNPNDEPASVLLEKIKVEKERLIKKGKIKKSKPLPPISEDEVPFQIPANWVWCRLGNITSLLGDGLHGTPSYSKDGEYYFVNGNNLVDGQIVFKDNTKSVNEEEFEKHKKDLGTTTVLVSINGTLGNVAVYNGEKIILGKSACYFNLLNEINKWFIKRFVDSEYFLEYAVFVARQTTIKNVSLQSMRLMLIPLPPLSEQQRIVAKLDELMAYCDELEASIKESQQQNEFLLQQVLREALEPKEKEVEKV